MNRRHFLATAVGALLQPLALAAESGISLGFSLYGMKSLPLDDALETCAKIGFDHVEFALNDGYPTSPASFSAAARTAAAAKLRALKLQLPCMMVHMSLTADDKAHARSLASIEQATTLARELVPEKPPILETVVGGTPAMWDRQKAGMAEKLLDWAKAAEKAKTTIAIKAHVGSAANTPERLLWLLEQVKSPAIQVGYDYSHFELQGIGMEDSMKALLPRTRFVHVKDSVGDARKFQFVLPGDGKTDYVKYFSLLKKLGYSGPVCVEVSSQVFGKADYDPVAAAKKSFGVLSTAMKKAS